MTERSDATTAPRCEGADVFEPDRVYPRAEYHHE
jgi:hypothetical protein